MTNLFSSLRVRLASIDRNEKTYWLGLVMLFVGLTWSTTVFTALAIVGASIAIESVITSYLAALLVSRSK